MGIQKFKIHEGAIYIFKDFINKLYKDVIKIIDGMDQEDKRIVFFGFVLNTTSKSLPYPLGFSYQINRTLFENLKFPDHNDFTDLSKMIDILLFEIEKYQNNDYVLLTDLNVVVGTNLHRKLINKSFIIPFDKGDYSI